MKKVMVRAWEIAREGVAKFGGNVKEYFSQALIIAWEEIKNIVTTDEINQEFAETTDYEVNVWEKYGYQRLYVNYYTGSGYRKTIGYLTLKDGVISGIERGTDKLVHKLYNRFAGLKVA